MKKLLCITALALLPLAALAQSALDGTWKTDKNSVTGADKPSRYTVKDGKYTCEHCVPRISVKADGNDQVVPDSPVVDTMAVKLVDDNSIELTSKKDGKIKWRAKWSVSADGKTMTREFVNNEANGTTSTSTAVMNRVGAPTKGAHAVTGSWKFAKLEKLSDETVTFKTSKDMVSMNSSDGTSYEAGLDGKLVPVKNQPGTEQVSLKAKGKNTFLETSYYKGKAIAMNTITISPDGKTMKIDWHDMRRNAKGSVQLVKQ